MKCTNCQGEWTPPANKSLSTCPFCQADILQMLNEQAEVLSTEVILANMLQTYGTDLLQNQQRLSAMISDLFAHDHKTKRLLLLSVRENIPTQLAALAHTDNADRSTRVLAIQHRLAEDAFLKNEIAEQIVNLWIKTLGYNTEDPDNSFEIVWDRGLRGFRNAKHELITSFKYENAFKFSEELALVKFKHKWGYLNKKGVEIIPVSFDDAWQFKNGYARVKLDGKWGFIDKTGKQITQLIYEDAFDFTNGLAPVKLNSKW